MPRLPIRSASSRVRSPVPRGRRDADPPPRSRDDRSPPNGLLRPSHSVRSRSHDGGRRQAEEATARESRHPDRGARPPRRRRNSSSSSISSIDEPRARVDTRGNSAAHRRRPRSRDSLSPPGPGRTRHASVGARDYPPAAAPPPGPVPASLRPGVMPVKPEYLHGQGNDPGNEHRPMTPVKYKPKPSQGGEVPNASAQAKFVESKSETKPPPAAVPAPAPTPAAAAPAAASALPAALAAGGPRGATGLASLMPNMPTALAAYAGYQFLTQHADKAKDWTNWFKDIQDAPSEMHDLSDKADEARNTITQIQELIKSRPDLLEGESGQKLKEKTEASIKSTDAALGKINKMLADLGTKGAKEGNGDMVSGLEKYWNSYRYKDEWQDKIKAADAELQKELASLGALMSGVYSKALSKPPPVTAEARPTVPAGATAAAAAAAAGSTPVVDGSVQIPTAAPEAVPSIPTIVSPPPMAPASADIARSTASHGIQATAPAPLTAVAAEHAVTPSPSAVSFASPPASPPSGERPPPPSLVAAAEGIASPSLVDTPPPRHPTIAEAAAAERPSRNPSIAETAVADMPGFAPAGTSTQRRSEDLSPRSSPPRPSSVAREEAAIGSPPPGNPRPRASSAAVPPITAAYMPTPPPVLPSTGGAPTDPRRASSAAQDAKASVDSITSELAPQDILLDAAWDGDIDAVAHALRRASANSCDLKGHTPLHLACERDHLAVAILLLDRGADVHARADGGRMPLHLAARLASADMVEMLLERAKADPNARTSEGRTPLHYAASAARDGDEDRRDVIRVLRDWGADPTIPDRKGKLPRDVAQARDHWDAASTLRRAEKRWEEDHKQNWLQRHGFLKK